MAVSTRDLKHPGTTDSTSPSTEPVRNSPHYVLSRKEVEGKKFMMGNPKIFATSPSTQWIPFRNTQGKLTLLNKENPTERVQTALPEMYWNSDSRIAVTNTTLLFVCKKVDDVQSFYLGKSDPSPFYLRRMQWEKSAAGTEALLRGIDALCLNSLPDFPRDSDERDISLRLSVSRDERFALLFIARLDGKSSNMAYLFNLQTNQPLLVKVFKDIYQACFIGEHDVSTVTIWRSANNMFNLSVAYWRNILEPSWSFSSDPCIVNKVGFRSGLDYSISPSGQFMALGNILVNLKVIQRPAETIELPPLKGYYHYQWHPTNDVLFIFTCEHETIADLMNLNGGKALVYMYDAQTGYSASFDVPRDTHFVSDTWVSFHSSKVENIPTGDFKLEMCKFEVPLSLQDTQKLAEGLNPIFPELNTTFSKQDQDKIKNLIATYYAPVRFFPPASASADKEVDDCLKPYIDIFGPNPTLQELDDQITQKRAQLNNEFVPEVPEAEFKKHADEIERLIGERERLSEKYTQNRREHFFSGPHYHFLLALKTELSHRESKQQTFRECIHAVLNSTRSRRNELPRDIKFLLTKLENEDQKALRTLEEKRRPAAYSG